MKKKRRKR